jgi:hypothetical protein
MIHLGPLDERAIDEFALDRLGAPPTGGREHC